MFCRATTGCLPGPLEITFVSLVAPHLEAGKRGLSSEDSIYLLDTLVPRDVDGHA